MCHKNKQARLAYRQARREARCSARQNRPVRPIVVYERRPGLIRMIVEHFLQRRGTNQRAIQQDSAYEPMPVSRTAEDEYEYVDVEKFEVKEDVRRQERVQSMGELPSYGQVMKGV